MSQTSASFYVLLALSRGPAHGLGIADDVAALTDGEVLLGPGTLYRCLKDLSRAGAIERADVEDPPGVTHRKYYRITPTGLAELRSTLRGLERVTAAAHARVGLAEGA
jgi:DNA-binding PadR family transcriptional regulator